MQQCFDVLDHKKAEITAAFSYESDSIVCWETV